MFLRRAALSLATSVSLLGASTSGAFAQSVRRIVVKDPTEIARGFYRIPWHVGNNAPDEILEVKARDFELFANGARLPVRTDWIIVPHCGTQPEPSLRRTITATSNSPFDIRCP